MQTTKKQNRPNMGRLRYLKESALVFYFTITFFVVPSL